MCPSGQPSYTCRFIRPIPAVKKITPRIAKPQGLIVTRSRPNIPKTPRIRPITPASSSINEITLIIFICRFVLIGVRHLVGAAKSQQQIQCDSPTGRDESTAHLATTNKIQTCGDGVEKLRAALMNVHGATDMDPDGIRCNVDPYGDR